MLYILQLDILCLKMGLDIFSLSIYRGQPLLSTVGHTLPGMSFHMPLCAPVSLSQEYTCRWNCWNLMPQGIIGPIPPGLLNA
jgi:hypothetical protein